MKVLLFTILLGFASVAVYSAPLEEEFEDAIILDDAAYEGAEEGVRQRRLTCDLLSVQISKVGQVNHAACAANCLSMGKAGGRCNGGICQCRKTTFGELWDKRFG